MATVRAGNRSALIVIDTQVGVLRQAWDTGRVIGNVAKAVDQARSQGAPVIWVQHSDEEMPLDSADWQLVPELAPRPDEPIIHKHFGSSFENTGLDRLLAELGVSHVVLAGAMTNWCVRATAYGALDRGYDMTLVKDAHTTSDIEPMPGVKIPAEQIVQELNVVMRWLAYPGRKCGTTATQDLAFSAA